MSSSTLTDLVPGTYELDPAHTEIGFVVRHIVTKVRGRFTSFSGTVVIAEDATQSTATAKVDLASVETGTKQRDDHLRSSDFFDVETNPEMTFETTGLRIDGDQITAVGNLTLNGVTKPIELDVEYDGTGGDPWGGTRLGFEANGEINRKDWGITFNIPVEGDKLVIGDKVKINLTVEAVLQQQDATETAGASA